MASESELAAWLLRKLMRSGCWGGVYKNRDDIFRHLRRRPRDLELVQGLIPRLRNDGLLQLHHGDCYSLNPRREAEILRLINLHYPGV